MRVLDAGCGRGEVLLACARSGAAVAGIDYSSDAVELTRELLVDYPDADLRVGDVTELPWPDASFDRILFSDVIEHLDPPQMVPCLQELRRVLRPQGMLLVHTSPNLLFMRVGWPTIRPLLRAIGRAETVAAVDELFDLGKRYHVNEQSVFTLRRALEAASFADPTVWIDRDVLRSGKYRHTSGFDGPLIAAATRLAATRPLRLFLGNDVLAVARR